MQKWEYKVYEWGQGRPGQVPYTVEEVVADRDGALKRFGAEGWELVAVYGVALYFKRPLHS